MTDALSFGWLHDDEKKDDHIYGVAVATVIDNIDLLGEARVQLDLPWSPGLLPWARLATTMAGTFNNTTGVITATESGPGATSNTATLTVNKANTTTTITNAGALGTATVVGQAYAVNWSVTVNAPGAR